MKRVAGLFAPMTDFGSLLEAFKKAFRGAGRTEEACRYHFHLERELLDLQQKLRQGAYRPSPYRYFTIFDPKERTISVAPFRDRVVHHALVGALEPIYERCFIYDSYATRKGKGTHRAVRRAQEFLRKNQWYLKTDVEKYFDSIDHGILLGIIERKIKDRDLLRLVALIIDNSDRSRGLAVGKGLPIGNLTSQFLANVYLDPADHFLKDERGLRYYVRYMDDMVFCSDSKDELKALLETVRDFLSERLGLHLKGPATLINQRLHGLPFLGFRVFPNLLRIKGENLRRMKRRMRERAWQFRGGKITTEGFVASMQSTMAHAGFGETLEMRRSLLANAGLLTVQDV